jgi:CBS domain-containing protein
MAERRINALPVVDTRGKVVGLLDIQDLVGFPVL